MYSEYHQKIARVLRLGNPGPSVWPHTLALEVHIGEINARDLWRPTDSAGDVWQIAAYRATITGSSSKAEVMLKVPNVNHLLGG